MRTAQAPRGVPAPDEVAAYYEAKTERIVRRYGPGPRVHYHTGLVDAPVRPGQDEQALRTRIHAAQEALLEALARAAGGLGEGARVLDVGCGLGGGALYWAERHGARVTAVTNAPGHVAWVERFARQAGQQARVTPRLCDALEVPGRECFDAVVAVESACYLPRRAWLAAVARLLRPGGVCLVADCLAGRPEYAAPFDAYWRTRVGSLSEYLAAGREAGLALEACQEVSSRAVGFWTLTLDLLALEQQAQARGRGPLVRGASQHEHLRLQQGLLDGGYQYALLVLRRPA